MHTCKAANAAFPSVSNKDEESKKKPSSNKTK